MSRKRKKFISAGDETGDMALQITSMADIFTIILVFLLKSLSTGIADITPRKGMVLPNVTASSQEQMKESLKLEILPQGIVVDQRLVARLNNFQLNRVPAFLLETEGSAPGESLVIEPVVEALARERAKNLSKIKDGKEDVDANRLMVMAHEKTPYSTLKAVMASAASAGYVDLQLVVLGAQ